ncbi:hypothetical protein MMC13_002396 [Lambiella insularis]|nr:hypothetical protein [Lambiella insularis]
MSSSSNNARIGYGRSFTFPMSHVDEASNISPFTIRQSDTKILETSEAFQVIRKLLSSQQQSAFCEQHIPSAETDAEAWILHRDITHAIMLPVLHIYRQATTAAQSFLCSQSIFDLELAFRGEARGAFSWLQCLIMEEEEWCLTRGCPACVVTYVLHSEPTIRLILAACRLSRSLRKQPTEQSLPLFDFWRSTLRKVLDKDPFWGPAQARGIEDRAEQLEQGMQKLIRQCHELSEVVPPRDPDAKSARTVACPTHYHIHTEELTRRPSSIFSKRKSKPFVHEEQEWMRKIVVGCWATLIADAAKARTKKTSFAKQENTIERRMSMTS